MSPWRKSGEYRSRATGERRMGAVLLTDGQQRKTLAAARSLGKQGKKVIVGETTRWATAAFSRYCRQGVVYPDPRVDPKGFWQKLREVIDGFGIETIFSMDDAVMDLVVERQNELEATCRLLLSAAEDYHLAADKGLALEQAQSLGIDCPRSIQPPKDWVLKLLQGENKLDLDKLGDFPLVIKPRKSSGSRGIRYLMNNLKPEELQEVYEKVHQTYPFPLIQECIPPGTRHDVCLLYDASSRLKASFVQKEIRHFPPDRGPSTLQESVWRPDLVAKADAIMRSLNWKGIAEVEFMHDPRDGKDKFMEINPRFWGSLHLAILAGVDFPWLYYRLIMGQALPELSRYQVGVRCRWLLPGDILHFLSNKDRWHLQPSFLAGKKEGVYDDIICGDDLMPVAGFFLAVLHYLPQRQMWRQIFKR